MDLDGDGNIDILSGCYSRHDKDMAGLFEVLRGRADGTFAKAAHVTGSDGEPLILPRGKPKNDVTNRICTRPFACDLDGDGKLDIVSGNFNGSFAWFRGEDGGKFASKAQWLDTGRVPGHSDPFLIDWDGDGDLDMLSGSGAGGVFLFANEGDPKHPQFAAPEALVEPTGHDRVPDDEPRFGDAHLTGPGHATRVWAADVDGDGDLDLLVGDQVTLLHCADGVDVATARAELKKWNERLEKLSESYPQDGDDAATEKWQQSYEQLEKEKQRFARDEVTGFVWLLRRK